MKNPIHSPHHLHKAAVSMCLAGILFFLYGVIVSVPEFFNGALFLRASLLPHNDPSPALIGIDPMSGRGVFFLAIVLIVIGATIDVWRRLHHEEWKSL